MERITKNTVVKTVDGVKVFRVAINDKQYQECVSCGDYFEVSGVSQKYCAHCAKIINIRKTSERNKGKVKANKE